MKSAPVAPNSGMTSCSTCVVRLSRLCSSPPLQRRSRRIIRLTAALRAPTAQARASRKTGKAAPGRRAARVCCRCCRAMPLPSTKSSKLRQLAYTATAGTFPLSDQSGARSAEMFYTAFVVKTDKPSARPVTFVFNGGPGAASAFLNLGLVGPRIAEFGDNGRDARGSASWIIPQPGWPSPSGADRSGRHRLEPCGRTRR